MKIIFKFPSIILTPIFSIWTIGPVMSTKSVCGCILYGIGGGSCCNSHQKLGVSICLTWINLLLTFLSGLAHVCIFFDLKMLKWYIDYIIFLTFSFLCLAIAMIFLILLQCLDKCPGCCCPCLPCCESNCYPVTQFTYLDVNNMDVIITQEEIELYQF